MSEILANLSQLAANGFRFPDHTVYIWTAFGISFLVLMSLLIWTQQTLRKERRLFEKNQKLRSGSEAAKTETETGTKTS